MSIPAQQAETSALLRRLTGAGPIETHISAVFVGRADAYKLKKAVALDFLDFSTLAARAHFIHREFALNHGFAPGLYRGALPVRRGKDGALALGGEGGQAGEIVDWVLHMVPVSAGSFFDTLAERGGLTPALLDQLADVVAAMHAGLAPLPGVAATAARTTCAATNARTTFDAPAALRRVLEGNLKAAERAGVAGATAWASKAGATLERLSPWLALRAAGGFVRRCHGDLHLGNFCLWQGVPTPFDALEFDETLATIDTGYDLAFLLMDLELRVPGPAGRAAANRVLNRYVARSGDVALLAGLPLWLSLRAIIRAHVAGASGRESRPWMDYAMAVLAPPPPRLVAVGGLPGTGKSTLARALAPGMGAVPGALVLRSDEIRKRIAGMAPEQPLPEAAYTLAASRAVFAQLNALAAQALAAGHSVVADAAFSRPEERAGIAAAAQKAPFKGLWLTAPLEVLRERVAARRGDASDATVAVLEAAAARDPGPLDWTVVDATADLEQVALAVLRVSGHSLC